MRPRKRVFFHPLDAWLHFLPGLIALLCLQRALAGDVPGADLRIPKAGDYALNILSPNLVELVRVNTKQSEQAPVDSWDWVGWVNNQWAFVPPGMSSVKVIVNGQTNNITGVGFKRRPLYAAFPNWDLRIGNQLYLRLSNRIADGASVQVMNNGTVWPTNLLFTAVADPLRYSPAIHVNQEGYLPGY